MLVEQLVISEQERKDYVAGAAGYPDTEKQKNEDDKEGKPIYRPA